MAADGMVVMGYLPSRWGSGDEATGPQMDEITTVVLARRSVPERVRSAAPTTPAAERGSQSFAACVDGRRVCSCCCARNGTLGTGLLPHTGSRLRLTAAWLDRRRDGSVCSRCRRELAPARRTPA